MRISLPQPYSGKRWKQEVCLRHADDRHVLHHWPHMQPAYLGMARHPHARPAASHITLRYAPAPLPHLPPTMLLLLLALAGRGSAAGRRWVPFQTGPHRRKA